ncbi:methionyl-tRNA synthetase [Methylobacterium variabile]|jgi:methionyl-tRNA synthetase|uniref:Methionine--tRNA ligase n=1 Tax=Methylobacterium variabile TaxID=298794 RepID=A0A0J6VJY6_9HYPH|nr:methionine--tRNA ligase [Methylobacterium variabile]KMO39446.1 methionyl-tRNA synthetase [Methylobacterium variabile]
MSRRILVTSALPYVSGAKHLGNLVGSLLPADVHARFHRQIGSDVLFICATDEHGTPTEIAAARAGLDPRRFCDGEHARQADTYRRFGLSFDHFGRSSAPSNHALTQHFYRRLDEAGLIAERSVPQIWSPADGRYLPDRYVLGTCPHCGDADARGDQCDACGTLLDPVDLVAPRSALSGDTRLELRESRHLFLRQSALVDRLNGWLDTRAGWPPFVVSLARSWLTADLKDRCITRDLSWGVPVPCPGFEGKVFYVWFDAPIAYIAATQDWAAARGREWRDWWWGEAARETHYVQFLGKDNVPFHAVSFPCTLIGSGEPWHTADVIKGFHWLTHEGGRFSTSQGRGLSCEAALAALPADLWRWWLIANAPEGADVDFRAERFVADVNKDLADVFGNLVQRVTRFAATAFEGRVPTGGEPGPAERTLAAEAGERVAAIRRHHEAREFRRAAAETRALWTRANAYVQDAAPWSTLRHDRPRAAVTTRVALGLIEVCAAVAWSIVPSLASSAIAAVGGRAADVPAWPSDVERLILGDRNSGAPLAPSFEPVVKLRAEDLRPSRR